MPVTVAPPVEVSVLIVFKKAVNEPPLIVKPVTAAGALQLVMVLLFILPLPFAICNKDRLLVFAAIALKVLFVIFFVGLLTPPSVLDQPCKVIAPVMVTLEKLLLSFAMFLFFLICFCSRQFRQSLLVWLHARALATLLDDALQVINIILNLCQSLFKIVRSD